MNHTHAQITGLTGSVNAQHETACTDQHSAQHQFDSASGVNTSHASIRYTEVRFSDEEEWFLGGGNHSFTDNTDISVTVDVGAGGCGSQSWRLKVTGRRTGLVQARHDGKGSASASISAAAASYTAPGVVASGNFSLGGTASADNSGDQKNNDSEEFDSGSVVGYFDGVGPRTITLKYSWESVVTTEFGGVTEGDEGIVFMGLRPDVNGCGADYGGGYGGAEQSNDGLFLDFEVTYDCPTPSITISNATACVGDPAPILNIVNASPCAVIHWLKNGAEFDVTQSTSHAAPTTTAGSFVYSAHVETGVCGSPLTSNAATLIVNAPATVPTALGSKANCPGVAITPWSVVPSGTPSFSYAWMTKNSGGAIFSPSTGSTYAPNTSTWAPGTYTVSVVVTNTCAPSAGPSNTSTGTWTILEKPTIVSSSLGGNVCLGKDLTLSVQVQGSPPFKYEWTHNGLPLVTFTNSPFNFSNWTVDNAALDDNDGGYAVTVSNDCSPSVTASGVVTVVMPPTLAGSFAKSVCAGDYASWTAVPGGTGPFDFTWRNASGTVVHSDASLLQSTFTILDCDESDEGTYTLNVKNACATCAACDDIDVLVPLTVHQGPALSAPLPRIVELCAGPTQQDVFTVTTSGEPEPDVEWYGPNPNYPYQGSGKTLKMVVTPQSSGLYFAVAKNGECANSAPSISSYLTVSEKPSFVAFSGADVCAGSPVTLSLLLNGGTSATYTWAHDGVDLPQAQQPGAPLLSIASASVADAGSYSVKVKAGVCAVDTYTTSSPLVVRATPTIQVQPTAPAVSCEGTSLTLSVGAVGSGSLTYQWFKQDGGSAAVAIPAATSPLYTLSSLSAADDGDAYFVRVTPSNGCYVDSALAEIHVPSNAVGTWNTTNGDFLLGDNWLPPCTPKHTANFFNGLNAPPSSSVLPANATWTLDKVQLSATSTSVQVLDLACGSKLTALASPGAYVGQGADLRLSGGTFDGDAFVDAGGTLDGVGAIQKSVDNSGIVRATGAAGCASTELKINGSQLLNRALGKVEVEPTSGLLRLGGKLDNRGTVTIKAAGTNPAAGIHATSYESSVAFPAGTFLLGGKIHLPNTPNALINGDGAIPTLLQGEGEVAGQVWNRKFSTLHAKDLDPASSTLLFTNCIKNDGLIFVSSGETMIVAGLGCPNALDMSGGGTKSVQLGGACFVSGGTCAGLMPTLDINGNFLLGPAAALRAHAGLLQIEGDFHSDVQGTFDFELSDSRVELDGLFFLQAQNVRIAAPNLGAIGDYDAPKAHAIGDLVIGPNPTEVHFDKDPFAGPSALYVKHLDVNNGSALHVEDVDVYADAVEIEPGSVIVLSQGKLFAKTIQPPNAIAQGMIVGDTTLLKPMPAPDCNANGVADSAEIASGAAIDCNQNGVPDACDLAYGTSLDQNANGQLDVCEAFSADRPSLSVSGGGVYAMSLHAGPTQANRLYVAVGTFSGTLPGTLFGGVLVPINIDSYTLLTLSSANKGAHVKTIGVLDGLGRAEAAISLKPGDVSGSVAGATAHYAFVTLDALGAPGIASNPIALELAP